MKIRFEIDIDYDVEMTVYMLRGGDWEYRAKKMNLPIDLVEKINKASEKELPVLTEALKDEATKTYTEVELPMKKAQKQYQASWDEIIDEFSSIVEKKTSPWFYEEYICKLTHYNMGLSNWDGNVVGRWWKEDALKQRRITAHEILLAHYFSIHRNNYKNSGLNDKQIWALAEIFAFAMTGLDKDMRKFWPWDNTGYYTDHNYPEIVDLQLALKSPFLTMKSFEEYVSKGISLVENLYDLEQASF